MSGANRFRDWVRDASGYLQYTLGCPAQSQLVIELKPFEGVTNARHSFQVPESAESSASSAQGRLEARGSLVDAYCGGRVGRQGLSPLCCRMVAVVRASAAPLCFGVLGSSALLSTAWRAEEGGGDTSSASSTA